MNSLALQIYGKPGPNTTMSLQKKVNEWSPRTCIKCSDTKKKHRRIQFEKVGTRYYVQNKRNNPDMWISKGHSLQCYRENALIAQDDDLAKAYNIIYDATYQQLNSYDTETQILFRGLIAGINRGYRTIEKHSSDAKERSQRKKLARSSIIDKYRALNKQQCDWEKELCEHSQTLSHGTRRWAHFIGRVDAAAVRIECDAVLAELKVASDSAGVKANKMERN